MSFSPVDLYSSPSSFCLWYVSIISLYNVVFYLIFFLCQLLLFICFGYFVSFFVCVLRPVFFSLLVCSYFFAYFLIVFTFYDNFQCQCKFFLVVFYVNSMFSVDIEYFFLCYYFILSVSICWLFSLRLSSSLFWFVCRLLVCICLSVASGAQCQLSNGLSMPHREHIRTLYSTVYSTYRKRNKNRVPI